MNNFTSLTKLFTLATLANFPKEKCVLINRNNKVMKQSNDLYLCLITDIRFSDERRLEIMSPYIIENKKDYESGCGYAWIDKDNNWIDNYENPAHGIIDECVIGFVEYENTQEDVTKWEKMISKINNK